MADDAILERIGKLAALGANPSATSEYKDEVRDLLALLLDKMEEQRRENDELEDRLDELEEELMEKDEALLRTTSEAQAAVSQTQNRYENTQRDLEMQVVTLSDQKDGLESVVRRLTKENIALKKELKVLKVVNGKPSIAERYLHLREVMKAEKSASRQLADELEDLKLIREAELSTVLTMCSAFDKRIQELAKTAQIQQANSTRLPCCDFDTLKL